MYRPVCWIRFVARMGCFLACSLLVACAIQGGGEIASDIVSSQQSQAPAERKDASAPVKVALLVPLSGAGQAVAVGKALKQAAELALFGSDGSTVQLLAKDDKGTPDGARAAADEAIREGAELIIGPVFAKSVQAIAPIARQANVPVLSFSNDRQVAGQGIYVLGFLPQREVERVVSYAASQGRQRFAALLPDDTYGKLAEAAFRDAVARAGGNVVAVESYEAQSNRMVEPTQRIAAAIRQAQEAQQPVDALFLPGGAETLPTLGPLLTYAGVDVAQVKLLGTGGWDYPGIGREGALFGAWYPSADPSGWREFSERFAKTFGSAPPRIASLAYDAATVAVSLSTEPARQRFSQASLVRAGGFNGVDGPFRLLSSGVAERNLAILEVQKFGGKIIDPPSNGFTSSESTGSDNQWSGTRLN